MTCTLGGPPFARMDCAGGGGGEGRCGGGINIVLI